ncbi:MAG: hypothetical protein AB7W37_00490 [Syntrophobacteraceae bacterium]
MFVQVYFTKYQSVATNKPNKGRAFHLSLQAETPSIRTMRAAPCHAAIPRGMPDQRAENVQCWKLF